MLNDNSDITGSGELRLQYFDSFSHWMTSNQLYGSLNSSKTRIWNAGLDIRQSDISGAGFGVFTSELFGAGEIVSHYYRTLVYDNFSVGPSSSTSVYCKA